MPSLQDSVLIFVLALLLFGPKKLPVLARELGKWIGEFRRASNEFKMQMEEELRLSEQTERQEKIAAIEAAAPVAPSLESAYPDDPEHPHIPHYDVSTDDYYAPSPEPIATNGDLSIMPPATGLPTARGSYNEKPSEDLEPLLESIPVVETARVETVHADAPKHDEHAAENATHG